MRNVEKLIFSNITYKEGRFYQQRLDANRVEKAKTDTLTGIMYYRYLKSPLGIQLKIMKEA